VPTQRRLAACPTVCFCPAVCACQTSASAQPSASARPHFNLSRRRSRSDAARFGESRSHSAAPGVRPPLSLTLSELVPTRTQAAAAIGRGRHRPRSPSVAPSHGSAAPPYPSAANRHSATPSPTRPHRPSFSRSRTHRPTLPAGRQRTTPLGIPSLHPAAPFPRLSLITAAIPSPFGLGAAEPASAHPPLGEKVKEPRRSFSCGQTGLRPRPRAQRRTAYKTHGSGPSRTAQLRRTRCREIRSLDPRVAGLPPRSGRRPTSPAGSNDWRHGQHRQHRLPTSATPHRHKYRHQQPPVHSACWLVPNTREAVPVLAPSSPRPRPRPRPRLVLGPSSHSPSVSAVGHPS
jgi:hypothetical protein